MKSPGKTNIGTDNTNGQQGIQIFKYALEFPWKYSGMTQQWIGGIK